jgi:hypothetical protein
MRTDLDVNILDTMRRYGGSFVQRLAEAGFAADDENLQKLKTAFPHYWAQYEEMFRLLQPQAKQPEQ